MIFVRGVNMYPAAVEELIRKYSEIVEYRVEFKSRRSMTEMNVKIGVRQIRLSLKKLLKHCKWICALPLHCVFR